MPTTRLEDVSPGAILARPVEDSMGRVLINAGEPLTDQLIAVLRKRGYAEVDIRPVESKSHLLGDASRKSKHGSGTDVLSLDEDYLALRRGIADRFQPFPASNRPMANLRYAVEKVLVERLAARKGLRVR